MFDLLNKAVAIIPPVEIKYRKFTSGTVNSFGIVPTLYGSAVTTSGSVQPLDNALYERYGLQLSKNAREVYIPANVDGMAQISIGGDILLFEGKSWSIVSEENWHPYDGWKTLIVVEDKQYNAL